MSFRQSSRYKLISLTFHEPCVLRELTSINDHLSAQMELANMELLRRTNTARPHNCNYILWGIAKCQLYT